ncbi:MAG: exodeoxyribonuclease VII large subunit [Planctomycetota bacterium]
MSDWLEPEDDAPDAESGSRPISVSELNQHLKSIVDSTFPSLWIAGEVSDLATPSSGHVYFTLKDDQSQVRAVMWRSTASRLRFKIANGQQILCFGNLEVYTVRGTYQVVVRKAQPQGIGTLQQAFERLKAKLYAEGLFSAERKRSLPAFPSRLAVITSPTGAAIHDFLVAARRRMPAQEVFVIPAQVQGEGAVETIVRGLTAAAMIRPRLDLVVVTRGGGSLEDLWTFNEEAVVRGIANCPIPTVSAIGHEVDITLSDLAADLRALSPTDAATKVFAERSAVSGKVSELETRLNRSIRQAIEERKTRIVALQNHPSLKRPDEWLHLRSRTIDELEQRAKLAIERAMERARASLAKSAASLEALSPLHTLSRGYSVTRNQNQEAITDVDQIQVGDVLETILNRGRFTAKVSSIEDQQVDPPSARQ